jgi:hypothetical protein
VATVIDCGRGFESSCGFHFLNLCWKQGETEMDYLVTVRLLIADAMDDVEARMKTASLVDGLKVLPEFPNLNIKLQKLPSGKPPENMSFEKPGASR